MGVNITGKDIKLDVGKAHLILWDLAGQVKFQYIRRQLYLGAKAVLLIFDLTRPKTFESIRNWLKDVMSNLRAKTEPIAILCGNKVDLKEERAIPTEEGQNLARKINAINYIETSAKLGENIEAAFSTLVFQILRSQGLKI